ncbi:MAG: ATP-binding protein [Candidatus Methanomethylophilaceae archaeon]|jgi:low affinity Fe/Cu permease
MEDPKTLIQKTTDAVISKRMYILYCVFLALTIIVLAIGLAFHAYEDTIIALPTLFILLDALITEKKTVNVPPMFILMLVGIMVLILFGKQFDSSIWTSIPTNILLGVILGLAGIIATYSLLRTMPKVREEKPFLTSFMSVCVGISLYMMMSVVVYYLHVFTDSSPKPTEEIMAEFTIVLVGNILIAVLFYLNKHNNLFKYTVNKYLESNAGTIGIEEYEQQEISKAIRAGESETVEYKSTLRTNLATDEKDVRMEKAVLKTIVAFLNTNGGTLLIGIADDGSVVGIDEQSFDNRDKLNLHMTHLIANQIGNEFLKFISFRLSDYRANEDDEPKGVMRVVCQKSDMPVFLIEGKTETFYVRSGPSSIDLTGTDLLSYASSRFKRLKRSEKLFVSPAPKIEVKNEKEK